MFQASTLSTNAAAVKSASDKTMSLTASSRMISSCFEVITYATKLAEVASVFPASPSIVTIAAKITSAGSIACSASEKAALTAVQSSLDSAVSTIESALAAVQEQLMSKSFNPDIIIFFLSQLRLGPQPPLPS